MLEVVAETEVAQHLKERVMVSRPPHVIDIASPQTFLARGGARKLQLYLAQEMILELVHAAGVNRTEGSQVGTNTSLGWRLWPEIESRKDIFLAVRPFSSFPSLPPVEVVPVVDRVTSIRRLPIVASKLKNAYSGSRCRELTGF